MLSVRRSIMAERIHDETSEVSVEAGVVIVDGPDGVAVTLTPEAALDASERLAAAAIVALGHRSVTSGT
jgi:hypothetical protein